jgi:hypothetical protein
VTIGKTRSPGTARWGALAIVLVLGLGAVLRIHGIGFGLPALNDPDELMFELGATRMLTGPTLNPGWFGHPATTTMYALAMVNAGTFGLGWVFGAFSGPQAFMEAIYADPGIVILPGRLMIAAFGLLCIWQCWRMGRQLDGWYAGLFAALLLACSPVHGHYSQIIRSDVMGTAFMLLTMGAALRIAQHGRAADYRWAAVWIALAVASKWPFAIAALSVAGAAAHRFSLPGVNRMEVLRRLATFAILAPVLLLVISPYLLLDYPTVLRNLGGEARTQHLGATGGGFLDNALWYFEGGLVEGLGVIGLVLAAVGLALLARDRSKGAVILPVVGAQALIICLHDLRWERWVVPLLPLLALAAGIAAARLVRWLPGATKGRVPAVLASIALLIVPLVLVQPAWTAAAARNADTRQAATQWGDAHIPAGSVVLVEHFAFDLMQRPWTVLFPLGDAGCVDAREMLEGRIDYRTVEAAGKGRSNIDYGTVARSKWASCKADYAILMEMERYRLEQHRFPDQYAAYQALLQDMDRRAVIRAEPGRSAGPPVTILSRKAGLDRASGPASASDPQGGGVAR